MNEGMGLDLLLLFGFSTVRRLSIHMTALQCLTLQGSTKPFNVSVGPSSVFSFPDSSWLFSLIFLLTFRTKRLRFKGKPLSLGEDGPNSSALLCVLFHLLWYVICLYFQSPQDQSLFPSVPLGDGE